jgi:lipid-binding SYLF domain-containing protein
MIRPVRAALILTVLALFWMGSRPAAAASAAAIDADVNAAIQKLYETTPIAKELAPKAKAILVFPNIVKAGFIVGAQYGEGALRKGGKTVGYYSIAAASYGLQAGVQSFGYAMFFMNDDAVKYLGRSKGWELGTGPSIVVVDSGLAKSLTTSTVKDAIYAFTFSQTGLMAGLGLQGSKISRIKE